MTADFTSLLEAWDGHAVLMRYDQPTGTWIFIALHSPERGMMVGGCRMKTYPTPADGLRDAMRLGRGMTHKWAAINVDFGGGKSVLAIPHPMEGAEREGLLHRFAGMLNTLGGRYGTGVDLGTSPADMDIIRQKSRWVFSGDESRGGHADPGPYTALGVFSCIRAAAESVFGSDDLTGRTVLIQGAGGVGAPLAGLLSSAGASLMINDSDPDRADAVAREYGGTVVSGDDVYRTRCDVFAPCAVGGILNERTIPLLQCRIVAGSANNQLERDEDAERLHARGILYAPDYVSNAGGAMAFGLMHQGTVEEEEIRQKIVGLGDTMQEILAEAARSDESPLHASARRVEEVLTSPPAPSP